MIALTAIAFLIIQETRIFLQPRFESAFSIDNYSIYEEQIPFKFAVAFEHMPCSTLELIYDPTMAVKDLKFVKKKKGKTFSRLIKKNISKDLYDPDE